MVDGELQVEEHIAMVRHAKSLVGSPTPCTQGPDFESLQDSDKVWRNGIVGLTFKTPPKQAIRSIVTYTPEEWDHLVKNDFEEAQTTLQMQCVVITGSSTYQGLPGFKLDNEEEPPEISVLDYQLPPEGNKSKNREKEKIRKQSPCRPPQA